MSHLILVPKAMMIPDLKQRFDDLVSLPCHASDRGPLKVWGGFEQYLYGFIDSDSQDPVAIAEASGRPIATPGWWITSECRGRGLGKQMIDLLAAYLMKDGVTGLGSIPIDTYAGHYHVQSAKLAARLRRHFLAPSH